MSRAREARILARRLSAETGVDVDVRWHPSGETHRRQWHVIWTDGPAPATMSELITAACRQLRELTPDVLAYHRIILPRTIALALIRDARHRRSVATDDALPMAVERLRHADYPDRGDPEDLALADTLARLGRHQEAQMPAILARYGLTGLHASDPNTPDNVIPLPPHQAPNA